MAWRGPHRLAGRAVDASATRRYCFFVPMSLYVTFDLASIRVQFYGAPRDGVELLRQLDGAG